MLDISTINRRYFDINISVQDDEGKTHNISLNVEPPKVKTLNKIISLSKDKENEDTMSEAILLVLNKNKSGYKVSKEIIDELDTDEYVTILTEYFNWVAEVRNSPN